MTDIADSAYVNDGPKNVKNLFEYIRSKAKENTDKKIIIILDEMDALLKKRSGKNQSDEDIKIVNTFLAELSGFNTSNNVIFIGTTNNYHSLDSAVMRSGRFSTKIKIDLPDFEGRKKIFEIHLNNAKKRAKRSKIFYDDINFDLLSKESLNLSGADIEEVIRMAVESRAFDQIKGLISNETDALIDTENILKAINKMKTSNGKASQVIKDFGLENLKELISGRGSEYFRNAVERLLIDTTLEELNTAKDTGIIKASDLSNIIDYIRKTRDIGFSGKI